jgi:TonB family protein
LVSLPAEEAIVSPEPPRVVVPPKPDKPKPVAKKPVAKKTQKKTDGIVKPTEPKSTRPAIAPLPAEEAPSPPPDPRDEQVAKLEHTEPGITLVTPLMEAIALKFPLFMKVLERKMDQNWSPPISGTPETQEVLVAFTIRRDGSVNGNPTIEQSSGNSYYDQAALRAVYRSSPFPPLPPAYPDETLKVYFSFFLDPDRVH